MCRDVNGPRDCHTKRSQKEKNISCILTHIYEIYSGFLYSNKRNELLAYDSVWRNPNNDEQKKMEKNTSWLIFHENCLLMNNDGQWLTWNVVARVERRDRREGFWRDMKNHLELVEMLVFWEQW